MESRFAFVVSLSYGYLFSFNAMLNAMHEAGTKAAFEVVYVENADPRFKQYREESQTAFNFPVVWRDSKSIVSQGKYMNFFTYKNHLVQDLIDCYDVVCFLDADHFFYSDLTKYFEMCLNEGKVVASTNPHYNKTDWKLGNAECLPWGKNSWWYVDHPLWFNTNNSRHRQILLDWIRFHEEYPARSDARPSSTHPCGALNRAICKNITSFEDDVHDLNGWLWFVDYDISKNEIYYDDREKELLFLTHEKCPEAAGVRIEGIHTRYWQKGRAAADTVNGTGKNIGLFLRSMNSTKYLMSKYNNMRLSHLVDHYIKGEITGKVSDYSDL